MTLYYYYVTYAFQSESLFYSSLNVKGLLAQNRRDIWSLSDSNGIRTHNHLVPKRTLNHLVFHYELSDCGFESRCCHKIHDCSCCSSLIFHFMKFRQPLKYTVWLDYYTFAVINLRTQSKGSSKVPEW